MRFAVALLLAVTLVSNVSAQSRKGPHSGARKSPAPAVSPADAAHSAVMRYIEALKIADMPEGREIMSGLQWIVGIADNGENFYSRPKVITASSIYAKLYKTDIDGVSGFKELFSVQGLSNGGTPVTLRYLVVAFPNRRTGEWKILSTFDDANGGDSSFDFQHNETYFRELKDRSSDSSGHFTVFSQWAFLNGDLKDALEGLGPVITRFDPTSIPDAQNRALRNALNAVMNP